MATLSSPTLILLLLLVVQLFFVLRPAAAGPLDDNCKQTKNPTRCISILNATDTHSSTAPLPSLEETAIKALTGTIRQVKQRCTQLYNQARNKKQRKRYGNCVRLYNGALGAIAGANLYLKQHNYDKIEVAVGVVQRAVDRSSAVVGSLGGTLQSATDDIKVLGEAIDSIAEHLRK